MRIVEAGPDRGHPIDQYGSRALLAQALVRAPDLAVTVLRVGAGGEIGRHPTTVDQLFLVVVEMPELSAALRD